MSLFGPPNVKKMIVRRNIKGLIKALKYEKDSDVRNEAAEGLGVIGDVQAVEPLLAALKHDNPDDIHQSGFHRRIRGALGKIGKAIVQTEESYAIELLMVAAFGRSVDVDDEDKKAALEELLKIGTPAVKPIIEVLHDEKHYNSYNKDDAIGLLGKLKDVQATEVLLKVLLSSSGNPYPNLGFAAAIALGQIKDNKSVEPLCAALNHSNSSVREYAAKALGDIGDARAIEPLANSFYMYKDWQLREQIIYALGHIGGSTVDLLIDIAEDEEMDMSTRQRAIQALGRIGDKQACSPLIALLKDKDKYVREATVKALGQLGATESLVLMLNDETYDVQQATAKTLKEMHWQPETQLQKAQLYMLYEEWDNVEHLGKVAMQPLINYLKTLIRVLPNSRSRVAGWQKGVVLLGQIGDANAIECLISVFSASEDKERNRPADALKAILMRKIEEIPTTSLEVISKFGDVTTQESTGEYIFDSRDDTREYIYKTRVVHNFSTLRELAKKELERRSKFRVESIDLSI